MIVSCVFKAVFNSHPQRAHITADRSWLLRSTLFVFCDQLTDGRIGVAQLEAHGAAATVNPKRFDDIHSDAFGGSNLFRARAAEDHASYAVDCRRCKADVPIISAGGL